MKQIILIFIFLNVSLYLVCQTINDEVLDEISEEDLKAIGLALPAILMEYNFSSHTTLNTNPEGKDEEDTSKGILEDGWGIYNYENLIEDITWLKDEGHSKRCEELLIINKELTNNNFIIDVNQLPDGDLNRLNFLAEYYNFINEETLLKGWDLARIVALCRWGYDAGYMSEDEAWEIIMNTTKTILTLFSSWEEFGANYILGRMYWKAESGNYEWKQYESVLIYYLLFDPDIGVWNKIDWPNQKNVNTVYSFIEIYKIPAYFYIAIEKNDIEELSTIINNFNLKDFLNHHGWPAIFTATVAGHADVVKLLIENSFDINAVNTYNDRTPLMQSLMDDNDIITRLFLDVGADISCSSSYGTTALMHAARYSDQEIVSRLLELGAEINEIDEDG